MLDSESVAILKYNISRFKYIMHMHLKVLLIKLSWSIVGLKHIIRSSNIIACQSVFGTFQESVELSVFQ
jgi:hypothetical protein